MESEVAAGLVAGASGGPAMRGMGGSESAGKVLKMLAFQALTVMSGVEAAHAGGPRWVAGSSYFNPSVEGQAVVWSGGQVSYYTDLGDLSAEVSQAQANAMVATAAAVWSGVNTAAVSITWGGSLAEDVNGANVTARINGVTMPADIQWTATGTPVGLVYDEDGSVIDAIYGPGASSALACQDNGVMVTVDNFAVTGNIAHALVLVNGLCATTAEHIANLEYQLIRGFGRVLGLDWSQTNEEMFVGDQVTTDGLAGWPVMHPMERLCNGGGGACMSSPTQLRTDDVAALNRLYPVTAANIGGLSGKTLTAAATISVQGTVTFGRGQGMQGVNVVLQPLVNGVPDVRYTATAVSGVFFAGHVGNPVTGTTDAEGNPLDRFGSNDASLEGFFDLSRVPLPPGATSAQYQLTFETLNPLYTGTLSVGPYTTGQVTPSGTMPVIGLGTLSAGSTVTQTVLIEDAADQTQSGADGTEGSPANVPGTGEWTGRITGYGHSGWFQFWARAGCEFTVEAQALDENGMATESKAEVVIGAWNGTDAVGVLPVTGTAQPFSGNVPGLTTLPVLTVADSEVRIGLADLRGDGRPDYTYRGRILYADSVTPARLPVAGGQIVIEGMGFSPSVGVSVNGVAAQVTTVTPNVIVATAPASAGDTGSATVQLLDTQTLGVAQIIASYDAEADDAIALVAAPMGSVGLGVPETFAVRAMNVTTQSPAAGVTVTFALTEGTAALGCGQISCSVPTAGDGTANLGVIANSTALAQITASLTSGSSVIAEFTGTAPPSIVALTPNLYIALGATVEWPVQATVVNPSGSAVFGQSVSWTAGGSGVKLAAGQSVSDADGIAGNQVSAGPFSASVDSSVSGCLPGTAECATFAVTPVHPEDAVLSPWSGTLQYVSLSQGFAPVVLRVTDAFGHPLAAAAVTFAETLYGWAEPCPAQGGCAAAPVLGRQMVQATSGIDGSVTLTPMSSEGLAGRLMVTAVSGDAALSFELDAHP